MNTLATGREVAGQQYAELTRANPEQTAGPRFGDRFVAPVDGAAVEREIGSYGIPSKGSFVDTSHGPRLFGTFVDVEM